MESEKDLEGEEFIHGSGSLLDTKTSQLYDILQEKLEDAFEKPTYTVIGHAMVKIALEHSPIDLAYAASSLPPKARIILYENLPGLSEKKDFMINTDSGTRVAILRHISDAEVKMLVESMPPDEVVEVLEDIAERRFRKVLELIDPKKAIRIREIKKHERNTAGRLMTNEFFSFSLMTTIGEVASQIRLHPGIDLTREIFVLDPKGELVGSVPSRNLIINPSHLPLKEVMQPVVHKVFAETLREEVVEIVDRYKIPVLAVIDEGNYLRGVITQEDVLDAIEDMADETIASMAGTTEKVSEHEPLLKRFLARAPWLVVTLCAGLVNVSLMSTFQAYDQGILTFAIFFVPLITGMSGNIGIQCSAVLVRSIALGMLSWSNKGEAALKECILGMSIGTVFGILCGLAVYSLDFVGVSHTMSPVSVGVIVGAGLAGACLAGTLLGVFSPLLFARIGVDPAVASGPIITAFNDILSMGIYFLIALGLSYLLV